MAFSTIWYALIINYSIIYYILLKMFTFWKNGKSKKRRRRMIYVVSTSKCWRRLAKTGDCWTCAESAPKPSVASACGSTYLAAKSAAPSSAGEEVNWGLYGLLLLRISGVAINFLRPYGSESRPEYRSFQFGSETCAV